MTKFDRGDAGLNEVAGDIEEARAKGGTRGLYGDRLGFYPAHWQDTNRLANYDFTSTTTVENGILRVRNHVRDDGVPVSAAYSMYHPDYGLDIPPGNAVEICQRVVGKSPFGHVALLWPSSDNWSEGEMDFPEGKHSEQPGAYHHKRGARPDQNIATWDNNESLSSVPTTYWQDWHRYRIEWTADAVLYFVDDIQVLRVADKAHIPTTPFKFHQQSGVHSPGDLPKAGDESTIETAWWLFDRRDDKGQDDNRQDDNRQDDQDRPSKRRRGRRGPVRRGSVAFRPRESADS